MAQTEPSEEPTGESPPKPTETAADLADDIQWLAGAISGAVATVVMGVVISLTGDELFVTIAGLYGQVGWVAGWAAHVVHGTVFGVIFAVALADPRLQEATKEMWRSITAGLVYGIVLAVVGAGIILPIWAVVIGLESPGIPFITPSSIAWHVVYGLVLGAGFAYLAD